MIRNAVFMMLYNTSAEQLALSQQALASILAQDIGPLVVYIVNNGSTTPTRRWLDSLPALTENDHELVIVHSEQNNSPCQVSNTFAALIYEHGFDQILGVASDSILPPNLYRKLTERPEQMVAANMDGGWPPAIVDSPKRIHGDLHMAVMLTRRSAYDALLAQDGYFLDSGFFNYCSDCDLKLRMAKAGITTAQLDIRCWHYGGASHRLAHGIDTVAHRKQVDADRAYFDRKWGFAIGSPQYNEIISNLG